MQALIDGDIVVYRSAFAAEHTIYSVYETGEEDSPDPGELIGKFESAKDMKDYIAEFAVGEHIVSRGREVEPVENVLYNIKHTLNAIRKDTKATSLRIFLSQGECYRHKKATLAPYKGNRTAPRPEHYQAARDYLTTYHDAEVCTVIEADDALAMYQGKDTVICSIDKDLLQVPGKHYNWVRNEKTLVAPRAGLCRLWEQVLMGDGTDNIPGIRGIGPVTAKKMVAKCKDEKAMYQMCLREWTKALKTGKVKLFDAAFANAETVVKEVYMLVKVGGAHAEEALKHED